MCTEITQSVIWWSGEPRRKEGERDSQGVTDLVVIAQRGGNIWWHVVFVRTHLEQHGLRNDIVVRGVAGVMPVVHHCAPQGTRLPPVVVTSGWRTWQDTGCLTRQVPFVIGHGVVRELSSSRFYVGCWGVETIVRSRAQQISTSKSKTGGSLGVAGRQRDKARELRVGKGAGLRIHNGTYPRSRWNRLRLRTMRELGAPERRDRRKTPWSWTLNDVENERLAMVLTIMSMTIQSRDAEQNRFRSGSAEGNRRLKARTVACTCTSKYPKSCLIPCTDE